MFKIFMRIALGLAYAATGAFIVYAIVSSKKRRKEKEKMRKVAKVVDEADKAISRTQVERVKLKRTELKRTKILIIFENKKTGERIEVDSNDHKKFDECMSNKDLRLLFE